MSKAEKGATATAEAPQKEEQLAQSPTGGEVAVVASIDSMFQADAGAGFSTMGANDFAIPYLTILQKGSPQVSRANAKYLAGAEAGSVMNTVTQDLYNGVDGILFIPCGYNKSCVEWTPRDSGGGLVAHHRENDPFLKKCKRNERGQLVAPETNNIIVDTAYHFGLLIRDNGFPELCVISMYSTQLKKSRMWNTTMRRIMLQGAGGKVFNPPMYSHMYRMTTVGETKDNYDWYGWKIVSEGKVESIDIYKMARDFSKDVESGNVRMSAPPEDFDNLASETSEEVPF